MTECGWYGGCCCIRCFSFAGADSCTSSLLRLLVLPLLRLQDALLFDLLELGDDVVDRELAVDLVVPGAHVHRPVAALLLSHN